MSTHIVITGPMGAGKTSLGREFAMKHRLPFRDSDNHLERVHGLTGREIAAARGVEGLHDLESRFVHEAVGESGDSVIAAAASVADDPSLLEHLVNAGHLIVFLDAEVDGMEEVTGPGSHRRPLTATDAARLHESRRTNAMDAGGVLVRVSGSDDVSQGVAAIEGALLTRAPSLFDG